MSKIHICHITLLNPAIHSRIFHKEGLSQIKLGYKVSIIGQSDEKNFYSKAGIDIYPIPSFQRLSPKRLTIRSQIYEMARKIQADIYQIHTPELLGIGKKLKENVESCKVIYDCHEDYEKNILHGGYYPRIGKGLLASQVKSTEEKASHWLDGVFFAEECFSIPELPVDKGVYLLNKFAGDTYARLAKEKDDIFQICYTGTISENWGIFDTLKLWQALNKIQPTRLIVAGHSQFDDLIGDIESQVDSSGLNDHFQMIGGRDYVDHEIILKVLSESDVCIGLYHLKENLKDRFPTKFYECMATGCPAVFTDNPFWTKKNEEMGFGIPVDLESIEDSTEKIMEFAKNFKPVEDESLWSWKTEEEKMSRFFEMILGE